MVDGLNFKDFVAFLLAFSAKASMNQKIECMFYMHFKPPSSPPYKVILSVKES